MPCLHQAYLKTIIFKCTYFGIFSLGSNFQLQFKGLKKKKKKLVHSRIHCIRCFLKKKIFKKAGECTLRAELKFKAFVQQLSSEGKGTGSCSNQASGF